MSKIVIRGMNTLPTSCENCRLSHYDEDGYLVCGVDGDFVGFLSQRPRSCPLEEIEDKPQEQKNPLIEWVGLGPIEEEPLELPTEKQEWAVETLIDYFEYNGDTYTMPDHTKKAYYNFIKENKDKYEEAKKHRYSHQREPAPSYTELTHKYGIDDEDNDYCGPYGTNIVDCMDYGIFPWGNS